jgi:hypothetical protein
MMTILKTSSRLWRDEVFLLVNRNAVILLIVTEIGYEETECTAANGVFDSL